MEAKSQIDNDTRNLTARFQALSKQVQTADVQLAFHTDNLEQLRGPRTEVEARMVAEYGCKGDALRELLDAESAEVDALLTELETEIIASQGEGAA